MHFKCTVMARRYDRDLVGRDLLGTIAPVGVDEVVRARRLARQTFPLREKGGALVLTLEWVPIAEL